MPRPHLSAKEKRRMNLYAQSRLYKPDGARPKFGSLKRESFCFRLKVIDPSKKCKSIKKKKEKKKMTPDAYGLNISPFILGLFKGLVSFIFVNKKKNNNQALPMGSGGNLC